MSCRRDPLDWLLVVYIGFQLALWGGLGLFVLAVILFAPRN